MQQRHCALLSRSTCKAVPSDPVSGSEELDLTSFEEFMFRLMDNLLRWKVLFTAALGGGSQEGSPRWTIESRFAALHSVHEHQGGVRIFVLLTHLSGCSRAACLLSFLFSLGWPGGESLLRQRWTINRMLDSIFDPIVLMLEGQYTLHPQYVHQWLTLMITEHHLHSHPTLGHGCPN